MTPAYLESSRGAGIITNRIFYHLTERRRYRIIVRIIRAEGDVSPGQGRLIALCVARANDERRKAVEIASNANINYESVVQAYSRRRGRQHATR